jgi:O-6-methylguanine DNA methyltransferase
MHFYNLVTDFKTRVYKAVKKIPKGKTATYKEVAVLAGRPRAWRAVGNILNKNFNPKIPCHRVIRSDGKIGGYNRGKKEKELLLKKEKLSQNL